MLELKIFGWSRAYPTDGPDNTQFAAAIRPGSAENSKGSKSIDAPEAMGYELRS